MSIHSLMAKAEKGGRRDELPSFEIGDSVEVHVRILEGDKERIQIFSGIVIARRGRGASETFTVRRIVDGEGVERIFPINSPRIADVKVQRKAVVRRAKLYFLRKRIGSKAFTLKERVITKKETTGRSRTRIKARKQKAESAPPVEKVEKSDKPKRARAKKPKKATQEA